MCDGSPELLFTENESNAERLWQQRNPSPYVKDAFHGYIVSGQRDAVNPANVGTKAAAHYTLDVPGGGSQTIRVRLAATVPKDSFRGFDPQSSFRAWIFRIGKNVLLECFRKSRGRAGGIAAGGCLATHRHRHLPCLRAHGAERGGTIVVGDRRGADRGACESARLCRLTGSEAGMTGCHRALPERAAADAQRKRLHAHRGGGVGRRNAERTDRHGGVTLGP